MRYKDREFFRRSCRRSYLRAQLHQRPEKIKQMLIESSLNRIYYNYKNSQFGLISPCRADRTTRENLEAMFRLSEELTNLGLYHIPVIHFWHGLGDKALFVCNIEHSQMQEIAEEFNLGSFIHGENGEWEYWESPFDECIYSGDDLKIIDVYEQFFLYSRIRRKIDNLKIKVEQMKLIHGDGLEQSANCFKTKIDDYERLIVELLRLDVS